MFNPSLAVKMATYEEWNQILLTYFTEHRKPGSTIYLAVDDEVLDQIGLNLRIPCPVQDFQRAVQQKVLAGERLWLKSVQGRIERRPRYLAFLAATVLAAAWMSEDEDISQQNYFKRLREVLGLPIESGRPKGLDTGIEESLWKDWSLWLQDHSYLPSAEPGEGAWKYISYPISQALLRKTDKERVRTLFSQERWSRGLDPETVTGKILNRTTLLSQHLRDLLDSRGKRREAVEESIFDIYEAWSDDPDSLNLIQSSGLINLRAGLYRSEHPLDPLPLFYLHPKQRSRHHAERIRIHVGSQTYSLNEERSGWFDPLPFTLNSSVLTEGAQYTIEEPLAFQKLIFPSKLFWILVPDPENPDFGAYATWERPSLGTSFIIVCTQKLLPQLQELKKAEILDWHGEPKPIFQSQEWFELRNCMVIASSLSGIFIENQELVASLQPHVNLNISLTGGLRVPNGKGWIHGYEPQVTIWSFYPKVDVQVLRITDRVEEIVSDLQVSDQKTNEPFQLQWPGPGVFRIEAYHAHEKTQRLVHLVDWWEIEPSYPEQHVVTAVGDLMLSGASVK